jgi:hypothetical protein
MAIDPLALARHNAWLENALANGFHPLDEEDHAYALRTPSHHVQRFSDSNEMQRRVVYTWHMGDYEGMGIWLRATFYEDEEEYAPELARLEEDHAYPMKSDKEIAFCRALQQRHGLGYKKV